MIESYAFLIEELSKEDTADKTFLIGANKKLLAGDIGGAYMYLGKCRHKRLGLISTIMEKISEL